jgi:hypothetical protein
MHKPRGAMREGHSNQAGVFRLIFAGVCRGRRGQANAEARLIALIGLPKAF